jgi:phage tail sheath protein FI
MAQYKTPGVYVVEENAFPTSVVEVETAVPAFIGYTEKAASGSKDLKKVPTRISSLAEFHLYFGSAPKIVFKKAAPETPDKKKGPANPEADQAPDQGSTSYKAEDQTRFMLYYSMRMFFDNGGGPCWIISLDTYANAVSSGKKGTAFTEAIDLLKKEQEPTMIVAPDAVLLPPNDWVDVAKYAIQHCADMQSRIAILDVYNGFVPRTPNADPIKDFRNKITADLPSYGVAYYPWVNASIVEDGDVSFTALDKDDWSSLQKDLQKALQDRLRDGAEPINDLMKQAASAKPGADQELANVRLHQALMVASPEYRELMADLKQQLNLLPPSGAIAGVYTRIDNTFGVFKAPANTGMASVVSPAVNITHDDQMDLNVPLDGKAINAIRTFPGRGLLIWGARTLDGNSQDWRYVNVRRTLIMLEQSVKNAAQAYVFAPNNAATWTTVSNTIGNFLTNKWKEGALVGATPPEAFSVDVGLGSTMTANDILDGYMLVTVKVALVRPAEFIVITFQQKMQTS